MVNQAHQEVDVNDILFVRAVGYEPLKLIELLNPMQVDRVQPLGLGYFVSDELVVRGVVKDQLVDFILNFKLFLEHFV